MSTRAVECGQELRLFVPGEYPCVRRFRYRRLLTFLWLQGYGSTFVAMLRQTNAYLCVFHLKHLVSQGQWTEALDYIIPRFLPRVPSSPPSLEARVLVKFLRMQRLFELEVVRHLESVFSYPLSPAINNSICRSNEPSYSWSTTPLWISEHSLDRRAIWARAAEIVGDLANRTPEFRDRLLLPDCPMGPQHVLPIGFGFAPFRRRRHVKTHTSPTGKLARQRHTRRVAKLYFDKRMSLPSCSHSTQELAPEIIAKARDDWFRRIMGTPATGNVAKPQCSSVPLATDAANRGPSMMRTRVVECGQELRLFVPGEYPCVRRFRYRRLLTFLWLQGYGYTFVAMLKQTNSYFCVFHLTHLVSQGQWTEALDYIIPRFLPRVPRSPPSLEARVLVKFLRMQRLFEWEVVRHLDKFSLDQRSLWARAAEIVGDLANRTPEFKDRLLLPDGPMGPQHVLPVGFGFAPFRRRRHVKKHTHPTRKLARQRHTRRVANIYFDKRMSLPSNSNSSQELAPEIIAKARDDWFRRIMEECVKAATCPELNEGCALQSSAREGTPVTRNVINRGCSSVPLATDADIVGNVIGPKKSLIPSVTGTGAPVAPICHAMFGDVINLAENSGISSMAETGTGREVCFIKSARQGSHPRKRPAPEQPVDYLARKKQLTAGAHGEANTAQEVCFTESARQGSHPRKRPMTEQMEDYLATKKQLTAGDNGEASVKAQSS